MSKKYDSLLKVFIVFFNFLNFRYLSLNRDAKMCILRGRNMLCMKISDSLVAQ